MSEHARDFVDMMTKVPTEGVVADTPELRRVLALPRRPALSVTPEELTDYLGVRTDFCLWENQCETLEQLYDAGGVLAGIDVGGGKTPISYVAPRLMDAKRPVLIIPGTLQKKTQREFRNLAKHFGQIVIEIATYEQLSRGREVLDRLNPDLLVLDEVHALKNPGSARSKAFIAWRRDNPDAPIVGMSGTITSRSLMEFHHLAHLVLGTDKAPLPRGRAECSKWARAVDSKVEIRCAPGALEFFLPADAPRELKTVRKAVGAHIHGVNGMLRSHSEELGASIQIRLERPRLPHHVRVLISQAETKKIDPSGEECTPSDVWRNRRTLSVGFHAKWRDVPPKAWLKARRNWNRQVREVLEADLPGIISERFVAKAAKDGRIPSRNYECWKAVEKDFNGVRVPVWHTDEILEKIAAAATADSIIWTQYNDIGNRLSELTGWSYYGSKGLAKGGAFIEDHPEGAPAIASVGANKEGRNLQYRFSHNVWTNPIPEGGVCHQVIGRTHRPGQDADVVGCIIFCPYQGDDISQALEDAHFKGDFEGARHKLLLADWIE